MIAKRFSLVAVVLLLTLTLGAGVAVTQQSQSQASVQITNICERGTLSISQIVLLGPTTKSIQIVIGVALQPGQSKAFILPVTETPTALQISGAVDQRTFVVTFSPLTLGSPQRNADDCLEALVNISGTTQPPGTGGGKNGLTQGESADQVLAALQADGVKVRQQGSQGKPKLGDAHDPMLLSAIAPFSAQLIWVSSSTGNLSSVLTWDQPAVDLDLVVIGLGGTACFALDPAGELAELCDRAPFGPVTSPIGIFAVFIINWDPVTTQAFVLALAG